MSKVPEKFTVHYGGSCRSSPPLMLESKWSQAPKNGAWHHFVLCVIGGPESPHRVVKTTLSMRLSGEDLRPVFWFVAHMVGRLKF